MKSGSGSRVVFACNGQQARSLSVLDEEERLLRDRLCGFSSVTFILVAWYVRTESSVWKFLACNKWVTGWLVDGGNAAGDDDDDDEARIVR